jgi:hypothetical protein
LENRRQIRGLILDARHQAERIGALLELVGELDTVSTDEADLNVSRRSRCCSRTSRRRRHVAPRTWSEPEALTCMAGKRPDLRSCAECAGQRELTGPAGAGLPAAAGHHSR